MVLPVFVALENRLQHGKSCRLDSSEEIPGYISAGEYGRSRLSDDLLLYVTKL
jgi:hypothetical protein